ncbi:uncharacterized protein LOC101241002 isoform X1 [Hydra vulgaris]|uniref:uncharacterized protein LOC101241002 isoform X1 n=1 Tax=Hydra vulgaris TaxID=6087 RepID=UPI001F5F118F|nr:uncharacterized protein LOC101241002 isoform X2 [Hydra vulgaris]
MLFKISLFSVLFTSLLVVNYTKIQDEAERFFTIDENGNLLEAKETVYFTENYKILTPPKQNMGSSLIIHRNPSNKIENNSEASNKSIVQNFDLTKTFAELNSFNETKGKKVLHKNIIAVHLIKNSLNKKLNEKKTNFEYSKTFLPSNKPNSVNVVHLQKAKITSNSKNVYNPITSLKPITSVELNLKETSTNLSQNSQRAIKASSTNNANKVFEEEITKNILNKTKVEPKASKLNETKKNYFEDKKNNINAKNMLTNSTMKGYLSKNSNFTISKIGIFYNDEEKESNLSYSKRKLGENWKLLNSNNLPNSYLLPNQKHVYTNQTLINSSKIDFSHENVFLKPHSLHLADTTEFVKLISDQPGFEKFTDLKALKKTNIVECTSSSMCPINKYCSNLLCYDCQKTTHACVEDEHCCKGLSCIYGRCDNKEKGTPGSICEKDTDCNGDSCCVIEPTIYENHGTCKRKLEEFHQCAPVLFRKVWIEEEKPKCGPCKDGLKCIEKGIIGSHLVCMKEKITSN